MMSEMKENKWEQFGQSISVKAVLIGALVLVLLIPLSMIDGLINERAGTKNQVLREIGDKWGGEVLFYGPILKVPYYTYENVIVENQGVRSKKMQRNLNHVYVFPERLKHSIDLTSKKLYRSIYESVVYAANISISGAFGEIEFSGKEIAHDNILWKDAKLIIKTTNLKSILNDLKLTINNMELSFEPVYSEGYSAHTLESEAFDFQQLFNDENAFNLAISYNGSDAIQTVPIGKITETEISADWQDPSFFGYFLPSDEDKEISDKGFKAKWMVNHLNRPFSQIYYNQFPRIEEFAYGVNLKIINDDYQQSKRTSKYGLLVVALTFLVFFMIQVLHKFKVHLLHYFLVGLALVLFYSLLVSFSEHMRFIIAYFIASSSIILMVSLYVFSIIKSIKFASILSIALIILYTYIYVIIQLDTYALISGSVGLFVILGVVMYFSRKVIDAKDELL
jgi:inner membrane protein